MNHPAAHIGTAADFFAQQHDEDDQPERIAPPGSTHPDAVGPFTAGPGMLYRIPPDPMERIATALEAIAGGNRKAGPVITNYDDEALQTARRNLAAAEEQYQVAIERKADMEAKLQTLTQAVADIDEALGKSKAGPALAAKAVIEAWRNPRVPDAEDPEVFCPDCLAGMESSEHHEKCGQSEAVEPTIVAPENGAVLDAPAGPPANDAPVEAWREYARSQGFAGPEIDKANRSQIRTALGVVQPVEAPEGGA